MPFSLDLVHLPLLSLSLLPSPSFICTQLTIVANSTHLTMGKIAKEVLWDPWKEKITSRWALENMGSTWTYIAEWQERAQWQELGLVVCITLQCLVIKKIWGHSWMKLYDGLMTPRLTIKMLFWPWLVWLSGLSAGLRTKELLVQFPVRAHAWIVDQVPSGGLVRGNHTLMFLSLSFSLPSPLSKNKINKIFKNKNKMLVWVSFVKMKETYCHILWYFYV